MNILGIDPGLARLGWSVLEIERGAPKRIHYGCIQTKAGEPLTNRLVQIYSKLNELMDFL